MKSYKLRNYKDLIAWQKAYQLCLLIYQSTKDFPGYEQFGLLQQIKRSALSVPSNIAEGYSRNQTKEYIRFLYIGYSSLSELETQLLLARDMDYFSKETYSEITRLWSEVQRILMALIKSLKKTGAP